MDFLLSTMRYPQSSNLLKFANSAKCSTEYALTSVPILFSFKTAFIKCDITSYPINYFYKGNFAAYQNFSPLACSCRF